MVPPAKPGDQLDFSDLQPPSPIPEPLRQMHVQMEIKRQQDAFREANPHLVAPGRTRKPGRKGKRNAHE